MDKQLYELNHGMKIILDAITKKQPIIYHGNKIEVTPKFSKIDFFKSLDGMDEDKEYFDYFGYSEISIKLYPTIRYLKETQNISYKELSNLDGFDISQIRGHSSIETTLKYYSSKTQNEEEVEIEK